MVKKLRPGRKKLKSKEHRVLDKKDISDKGEIMDGPEGSLGDIWTLFNYGYDYYNEDRIKRKQDKTSKYYQTLVPILSNLFHCYQNKREVEKDKSKAFIGWQNIKKINYNNRACDHDCWQMNSGKNEWAIRIIGSDKVGTNDDGLRAVNVNDQVAVMKCNNEDCHIMIVLNQGKVAGSQVKEDKH